MLASTCLEDLTIATKSNQSFLPPSPLLFSLNQEEGFTISPLMSFSQSIREFL
jgi:hypothetical protein